VITPQSLSMFIHCLRKRGPYTSRCFRYFFCFYLCLPLHTHTHSSLYRGCLGSPTGSTLATVWHGLISATSSACTNRSELNDRLATLHHSTNLASASTRTRHAGSTMTSQHVSCAIRQDPLSTQSILALQTRQTVGTSPATSGHIQKLFWPT
jgi:hypothetical protein